MAIQFDGQLELGTHPIGTGHQHRLAIALGHFKQGAKSAQATEHAIAQCFSGKRFDPFDERITCIDIDTGIAIGKCLSRLLNHILHILNKAEQRLKPAR